MDRDAFGWMAPYILALLVVCIYLAVEMSRARKTGSLRKQWFICSIAIVVVTVHWVWPSFVWR